MRYFFFLLLAIGIPGVIFLNEILVLAARISH